MPDTDVYPGAAERGTAEPPEEDTWLSIGEAAARLGLSIETLRRYDDSGRLRAHRSPGNQRRYRRSQIDAALNAP